jgi:hypothetical protein
MNKKPNKYEPPKADSGDIAHLVTKAALSFIPPAPDLFEYFVRPPLQKRLEKWQEDIAQALRDLEKNPGINLETLQNNERFITIIVQTTQIAVRNHQREKLHALRNAIVNSAINPNLEEDLQLTFIRFIEELTPLHLSLLMFLVSHEDSLKSLTSYPSIYQLVSSNITDSLSKDQFKMLMGDLNARGLIWISQDIDDFEDIYQASAILDMSTKDDLPRIIVTNIAKEFIGFISDTNL